MAGLAIISMQQRIDLNGRPYAGAKAYITSAESLAPLTTYQDYGLGTPHAYPVAANAYGVFPAIYLDEADEFYRLRVTTSGGVTLDDLVTLPIIGPTGGGGGAEVPVDTNSLLKTGYPIWLPKSGSLSGFVRMNGRTIGSATSGASERANSDCEQLFLDYWNTYSNTFAPVSGGRGVSAAADWAANKTITLLDMRNKGSFGLDDMGNSAAGGFSGVSFTVGDATTAASPGGSATHTLTEAQLPSLTKTLSLNDTGHLHSQTLRTQAGTGIIDVGGGSYAGGTTTINTGTSFTGITGTVTFGSGGAHPQMPPFMLGTWYQRL